MTEFGKDIYAPILNRSYAEHTFLGDWQTHQYQLKENLPDDTVLMVVDLVRNRLIKHQAEAKEAGFATEQVTIHPVVITTSQLTE